MNYVAGYVTLFMCYVIPQWWIQGSGPGGRDPPPLFLDETEAQRAEKIFFGDQAPPVISRPGSATVPVVRYVINTAHHGIKTVSIMARILERFQESVVKLYQN